MPFVPSSRLILLAALLMPATLFAAAQDSPMLPLAAGGALLVVFALLDLAISREQFGDLKVQPDPVTRMARGSAGELKLHLRRSEIGPQKLTLGLPLPVEFLSEQEIEQVSLAGEGATHWTVFWSLTPRSRGVYACPDVYVEVPSKLGLFGLRRRFANKAEIRVYPNLRRERRQLANLFLNRGSIGVHAQRMVGQGREYEQLREYNYGDSMLDIHWKASAKRGELVTKTYQVERTQEIYLVLDHSRLSGLRSTQADRNIDDDYAETILERYVTVASVLGMVAEREGDLFGLLAFGQKVSRFVRAGSGKQHGQVIQDALFDLKTEPGSFDLDELFTFIRTRLRRRALLIFLTDLGDPVAAEDFKNHVGLVASRHLVLANSIRRKGVYPIYGSPATAAATSIPDELAGHYRWAGLNELQAELRAQGVELSILDDENLSVDVVNQYLNIKQRQLL